MAILGSCCCWNTVRKGSYASALYTTVYYIGCSIIMGVTIYFDMEYYWNDEASDVHTKPKNSSFLEPTGISEFTMICILLVFVLSVCGIFSSILLCIGLHFEMPTLLIPWMIIILISSFLDITHSIYWLTLDNPYFSPITAMLFTIEVFLCLLNIYALLCVYSQYEEYRAGRGTAAYGVLLETIRRREQTPSSSTRCGEGQATATSYLTGTASHSTRDSTIIVADNLKMRRVQFTNEEKSVSVPSPTKSRVGSFGVRDARIADLEEEEADYSADRSDYLWCTTADERTLICDLPTAQEHESNKEFRSKKRTSVIEVVSEKEEKNLKKKELINTRRSNKN